MKNFKENYFDGSPKNPLYIPYNKETEIYQEAKNVHEFKI